LKLDPTSIPINNKKKLSQIGFQNIYDPKNILGHSHEANFSIHPITGNNCRNVGRELIIAAMCATKLVIQLDPLRRWVGNYPSSTRGQRRK
jgi:hypothetical protein